MRDPLRFIIAIALLTAVSLGGLAACNTEPTCDKAAENLLTLIDKQNEQMLAKFPEGQRKQLAEMTAKALPKERLVEECTKSFTKEQIACTVAAKSLEEASRCNQAATPTGDQSAPGTPPGQPAQADVVPAGEGANADKAAEPAAEPTEPAAEPGDEPAEPDQAE